MKELIARAVKKKKMLHIENEFSPIRQLKKIVFEPTPDQQILIVYHELNVKKLEICPQNAGLDPPL